MKNIISVSVLVIVMLLFSSCNSNDSLTGSKWTITTQDVKVVRQFNKDGTTIEWVGNLRMDGICKITENEISATLKSITNKESGKQMELPEGVKWRWSYSVDGDELTLVNLDLDVDNELIYTREE